jgi:predicted NUDIX family NTP pyrophosphohydrolase
MTTTRLRALLHGAASLRIWHGAPAAPISDARRVTDADWAAIAGDWAAVGGDLRAAMDELAEESGIAPAGPPARAGRRRRRRAPGH